MDEPVRDVFPGIFEDSKNPRLIGGHCPGCKRKFFPKPIVCPYCLGPVGATPLSREGVIYSFSIVRIKPPFGLPQPYPVGLVDLVEDGLRIITLLDPLKTEGLAIGKNVHLMVEPLGVDAGGQTCLRYYFTPV